MSFVHDDNTLDLSRESGYILHLKAKIQAQNLHMDWLQDNLKTAHLQRKLSIYIAILASLACLLMYAAWGK